MTRSSGVAAPGPVFIGGLARSGKTELRIVLGAHPELSLTRHSDLWGRYFGRFGHLDVAANLRRCLEAIGRDERVRFLEPDVERIAREMAEGPKTYARLFGLVHRHHAEALGKPRWGEQLGFVERFAEPIFETFPTARMIHMIRDPRSAIAVDPDGPRPGRVGWATARWLHSARLAERNAERHPQGYLVLRYESLAERPEETVDLVRAFVGLRRVDALTEALASLRFEDRVDGGSPSRRAADVAAAFVERRARGPLRSLGYPPWTRSGHGRRRLVDAAADRAALIAWHLSRERRLPPRAVV